MPLTVYKRGGYWYMRGRASKRSRYLRQSTGLAGSLPKSEAQDYADAEAGHIRAEQSGERGSAHTFAQALDLYRVDHLEVSTDDAKDLKRLFEHFGSWRLSRINQDALDAYIRKHHPKAGPAGRQRRAITPLTAILRKAARRGWCDRPAFERPKQPSGRVKWLTVAEAKALVGDAGKSLKPLVTFLLHTGARLGEALALDWRNVDLKGKRVAFLDTKNGTSRGGPLNSKARVALANLPGGKKESGPVFAYADRWAVYDDFVPARAAAGLAGFTVHDLRHTFASWLVQRGVPLRTVAELLGHKSIVMVSRYAHLAPDHLRSAVDVLDEIDTIPAQPKVRRNA